MDTVDLKASKAEDSTPEASQAETPAPEASKAETPASAPVPPTYQFNLNPNRGQCNNLFKQWEKIYKNARHTMPFASHRPSILLSSKTDNLLMMVQAVDKDSCARMNLNANGWMVGTDYPCGVILDERGKPIFFRFIGGE